MLVPYDLETLAEYLYSPIQFSAKIYVLGIGVDKARNRRIEYLASDGQEGIVAFTASNIPYRLCNGCKAVLSS